MTSATKKIVVAFSLPALIGMIACGAPSSGSDKVSTGRALYHDNCAACHGPQGRGDGYVLFNPPVADLTDPTIQAMSDDVLIGRIHAGRANTAMGSWRLALSPQEMQAVVAYITTLK